MSRVNSYEVETRGGMSRVMDLLFIEEGRQRSPMVESINRSRVSYFEELLPKSGIVR